MIAKRKPERILLRVAKGALVPADEFASNQLRRRNFKIGSEIMATVHKARSPGFHRLVHAFGQICADNVDAFSGMDAHAALKRIQWEGNIGCEEIAVQVPGVGLATVRWPLSLSFDSMDEVGFDRVFLQMCRYVSERYWPDLTPEQIADMAQIMPTEVAP